MYNYKHNRKLGILGKKILVAKQERKIKEIKLGVTLLS